MLSARKKYLYMIAGLLFAAGAMAFARDMTAYIPDTGTADAGMTLWQVILSGGEVMLVLGLISLIGVGVVIHFFMTIKPDKLLPREFSEKVMRLVSEGKHNEARVLCRSSRNMLSDVYAAGLDKTEDDKYIVKERIEDRARRQTDALWQKLSYLSDIAAISPMVGLLGTVLGMIQAFNVIAFQTGAVKPILLAGGISKAMVTTATGLIIAIPAMIFYSVFRARAHEVERRLGDMSSDFWHILKDEK